LTKVQVPAIRERVVAMLANVDMALAKGLAAELGMEMPKPMPRALKSPPKPEVTASPALSLFARPGDRSVRTRRVAILVADGVDVNVARALHEGLSQAGAVPRYIGPRLGMIAGDDASETIEVEVTLETMPSVLFDAVAFPGGKKAVKELGQVGHAAEFLKDQYRHAKAMLMCAEGSDLLENAGVPRALSSGKPDPGVLVEIDGSAPDVVRRFIAAIARHRHHEREMDPPPV
jgi:catalase